MDIHYAVARGLGGLALMLWAVSPLMAAETVSQGSMSALELPTVNVYGVADQAPSTPVLTKFGTQFNAVSEEQIERRGALDFYDALKGVPGVMVRKQNILGGMTGASLFVRGRGASHPSPDMTILFDDVPRSGVLYGQTLADGIPIYALGGMEVYKYPQPSRYGSGYAMLNFVPKFMAEEGTEIRIGGQGGSYGTFAEHLGAGTRSGGADAYFAQSLIRTDGHVRHSSADQASYYLNTGYALSDEWSVRLMANTVRANTYAPANPLTGRWDGAFATAEKFETESSLVTLSLSHDYEVASGQIKAYYNKTNFYLRNEASQQGSSYTPNTGHTRQSNTLFGLRVRENLRPWSGGEIVVGMDLDKTDLENRKSYFNGKTTVWSFPDVLAFSPYLAVSHTFGETDSWHVTPSAGLRWHHNDTFGDKTSPQAGLVAGYGGTEIYANYARGVDYPSPVIIQGFLGEGTLPRSIDLGKVRPEVVDHYELGLTHAWKSGSVGVTAFYDRGRDRLRVNLGWPGFPRMSSAFNSPASRYRIRGMEVFGSVTPHETVDLSFGLTWLRVKATGDDGIERDRMPYTPEFTLQAGATWRFAPGFSLHADYRYLKDVYCDTAARALTPGNPGGNFAALDLRRRLPNQNVFGLRLEYAFDYEPWSIKDGKIFVSVDNLFGKRYASALELAGGRTGYYLMPGRTFMAGFDIRF